MYTRLAVICGLDRGELEGRGFLCVVLLIIVVIHSVVAIVSLYVVVHYGLTGLT